MRRLILICAGIVLIGVGYARADINKQVAQLNIGTSTKGDVIAVFGEPIKYIWEQQVFGRDVLPDRYVMVYPGDFHVLIMNNRVNEIRFEGPSDYVFGDRLVVGCSRAKALRVLGSPEKILDGKANDFRDNVFYKNIDEKKGDGYYARPDRRIKIWISNDKVRAICLTGNNFNAEWREAQLPKTSPIDKFAKQPYCSQSPVGTWQSVDIVNEMEDFQPGQKRFDGDLYLGCMKFYKHGRIWGRTSARSQEGLWSNGILWSEIPKDPNDKFLIKEIDGSRYMFIERSGDVTQKPDYYVLKKRPDEESKLSLAADQNPIGTWQSVDFVFGIEDFTPGKKSYKGKGKGCVDTLIFYRGGKTSMVYTWNIGTLWDPVDGDTSMYVIMEGDGSKYMFMEWMSGDVTRRGIAPCYYVLKKVAGESNLPQSISNGNHGNRRYMIPMKITPSIKDQTLPAPTPK